ncbi:MAG TPA: hypothetical protein VMB05_15075 [Solirubrobacteraceae bacterium]|nr:hypothetical protein [Solirubrobacteraceae bacterium]
MSRFRPAVVATAVVCSLVALAIPALAQAHEYKVEGKPLTGSVSVQKSFHTSVWIKGTPYGVSVEIRCDEGTLSGTLASGGTSTLSVALKSCVVEHKEKPMGCAVKEPFELTHAMPATLIGTSVLQQELNPAGSEWNAIVLEGAGCALQGYPIYMSGTQICEFELPAIEHEQENQTLVCETSGSTHMRWAGKMMTLEGVIPYIHLVNGKGEPTKQKWSAQ